MNKMLHRGSMVRLSSSMTNIPILSTCLFLLFKIQVFHALPTASSFGTNVAGFDNSGNEGLRAFFPSTVYGSAYPYNSYRPGARLEDSYRPYSGYEKDSTGSDSNVYIPEPLHPNSVYSRQSSSSSLSQGLDKVLQLIEKEIEASDLQQQGKKASFPTLETPNEKAGATPEQQQQKQQLSPVVANTNTPKRNNKPRLLPLPSVPSVSSSASKDNTKTVTESQQDTPVAEQSRATLDYSPAPPPFAPELDPQYERRQYGLGALTLLDQAGPFW